MAGHSLHTIEPRIANRLWRSNATVFGRFGEKFEKSSKDPFRRGWAFYRTFSSHPLMTLKSGVPAICKIPECDRQIYWDRNDDFEFVPPCLCSVDLVFLFFRHVGI